MDVDATFEKELEFVIDATIAANADNRAWVYINSGNVEHQIRGKEEYVSKDAAIVCADDLKTELLRNLTSIAPFTRLPPVIVIIFGDVEADENLSREFVITILDKNIIADIAELRSEIEAQLVHFKL